LRAKKRVEYAKKLLEEIGLGSERLEFFYIAASEAPLFAETAKKMTERAKELGPNPYRVKLKQESKKDKE
jgi:F420-non-reducing hydrogenase iron-sulfur subunit